MSQAKGTGTTPIVGDKEISASKTWNPAHDPTTALFGCSSGHLATKNDASWGGPCEDVRCRAPLVYLDPAQHGDVYLAYRGIARKRGTRLSLRAKTISK